VAHIALCYLKKVPDGEMLARLASLLKEKGRLSRILVDKADGVPHHSTHVARYGNMGNAYELIGYHPKGVFNYIGTGNSLTTMILKLATDIIAKVEGTAGYVDFNKATDVLTINGELALRNRVSGSTDGPSVLPASQALRA
jgi:hypothetical protein